MKRMGHSAERARYSKDIKENTGAFVCEEVRKVMPYEIERVVFCDDETKHYHSQKNAPDLPGFFDCRFLNFNEAQIRGPVFLLRMLTPRIAPSVPNNG